MTPQEKWAHFRPLIEAALATGPGVESIEDVERFIADGRYIAWFGADCCIISETLQFAQKKVFCIRHAGGNLRELVEHETQLSEWARAQGCDAIMGEGRPGWERVFQSKGFRLAWVAMWKDLVQ